MASRALIVLGMHRSGTSALTRTLNLMGVDLGERFYQGPVNPKGYWEHEDLLNLNDALISDLNGHWRTPNPLRENWWHEEAIISYRDKIRAVLTRDFSQSKLWGMKDPRLCLLLPLYLPLLDELKCEPSFVFCLRNPIDVALSLQKRDQTPAEMMLVLWLRYVLDAFYNSYPYRTSFISYPQLLNDWKSVVSQIAADLEIKWPASFSDAESEMATFLSPEMRSFQTEGVPIEGGGELEHWLKFSYEKLYALTEGTINKEQARELLEIKEKFDRSMI